MLVQRSSACSGIIAHIRLLQHIRSKTTNLKRITFSSNENIPLLPSSPVITSPWAAFLHEHSKQDYNRKGLAEDYKKLSEAELEKYQKQVQELNMETLQKVLGIIKKRRATIEIRVPVPNRKELFLVRNFPDLKERLPELSSADICEKLRKAFSYRLSINDLADYELPIAKSKRFIITTIDMKKIRKGVKELQKNTKRSFSGWNLFIRSHSSERLNKENMQKFSDQWRNLSEDERKEWNDKAKEINKPGDGFTKYDFEDYIIDICVKMRKIFGRSWKDNKNAGSPVISGYILFLKEQFGTYDNISPADRMRTIAADWNNLPEKKKEEFNAKAREIKEKNEKGN